MEVKVFRLTVGQEIIAETDDKVWKTPMLIGVRTTDKQGQYAIDLKPLLHFAKESEVEYNKAEVLFSYYPNDNLAKMYEQTANSYQLQKSGLVAPSQKDIERASRVQ